MANISPPKPSPSPAQSHGAEGRYRVLVVDDDPLFLSSVEAILAEHVDVFLCSTPEQAIQRLNVSMVHVVCSDFGMPKMNGVELLRHVESMPYFVGTLLITGNDQYISDPSLSHHGYVLLKPFAPERFVALVMQLCNVAQVKRSVQLPRGIGPTAPAGPTVTELEARGPASSRRGSSMDMPVSTPRRRIP